MTGSFRRRAAANLVTVLAILVGIPVLAAAIAYPTWYLGTNHRLVYTLLAALAIVGHLVRRIARRR
jgi:hypothetical protein